MRRRVVALAAGGTAGHVMIAVAIAEAFARAAPDADIVFLGSRHGTETTLVPARGFELEVLPGAPWKRQRLAGKLAAVRQTASSVRAARRVLAARSVNLVIGTGGYASFGALAAARMLGVATAIHEANVSPGLANRLLGRVAERIYLSSEAARSSFPSAHSHLTGTPLRAEISRLAARGKVPPAPDRPARVLITAGSEGSSFLDREAPRLLGRVSRLGVDVEVRHQAGGNDPRRVRAAYAENEVAAAVVDFIGDMADAYEWADMTIAACGAGTVAEIAAVSVPALLVPLSGASDDHQRSNADFYASAGGAWTAREEEWNVEILSARAAEILRSAEAWCAASRAMQGLAHRDAAGALVADCLDWMGGRW